MLRQERLSDQHLLHLRLPGSMQDLVASCSSGHSAQAEQDVLIQMTQCLWFDATDQRLRP